MNNIVFGVSGFLSCSRPHFPPSSTVRVNESLLRRGHFSSVSHLRSLTLSKKSLVRKRSGKELEKVLRDHITQSVSLLRFLHDSYLQRALLTRILVSHTSTSLERILLFFLSSLCLAKTLFPSINFVAASPSSDCEPGINYIWGEEKCMNLFHCIFPFGRFNPSQNKLPKTIL